MLGKHTSLFCNVHSNTDLIILYCLPLSSFRTPEKESISKAVLQKSRGHSQLWAHSKDPLKQPLLKAACTDPDVRDVACQAFIDILLLFSLGPENSRGKEELRPWNTSTEIIPRPHYWGHTYIKQRRRSGGFISSAWLGVVSLLSEKRVLFPPSAPQLVMTHLAENMAAGESGIYFICPEQTVNTAEVIEKQQLL